MRLPPSGRRALLTLVLGALAFAASGPAIAADPWSARVTVTDERGQKHRGLLDGFTLETRGHPAITPTDTFVLNAVPRKAADVVAIALQWAVVPGAPPGAPRAPSVGFEFADGSSAAPMVGNRGRAPVTALSFRFTEDGRDPVAWTFPAAKGPSRPLGDVVRIEVEAKSPRPINPPAEPPRPPRPPGPPQPLIGSLCVHKFEDRNGNGVQDEGEPPLPDWSFTVTDARGTATTLTTDAKGVACAKFPAGKYVVGEAAMRGWTATTQNPMTVSVEPGKPVDLVFGNRRSVEYGVLCVHKFEDADGNGVEGPGEPPLPGWTFTVMDSRGATTSLTTDEKGVACGKFPAGRYVVRELPTNGWMVTTTNPRTVDVVAGGNTDVAFGNRRRVSTGTLCVHKFDDLDGNGVQSPGEPGIPGWPFTVSAEKGASIKVTTRANGTVCFETPAGVYTVVETLPVDWVATTPTSQIVTVAAGQTATLNFGNRVKTGRLCVHKFDDRNGNGVRDLGEPGLPGWVFTAKDESGARVTIVTKEDGIGCADLPVRQYAVEETPKANWTPTTPTNQSVAVVAGQNSELFFGNRTSVVPGPPLPPGVTIDPTGCDCGLGAVPMTGAIVLKWAQLCPTMVMSTPTDGSAPVATYVYGEPRLYRADHGVGNWTRVVTSNHSPGVLREDALESSPIDASDKELYRDMVRHYLNPDAYVETPLGANETAASVAAEIRDLAYLVLVTRFGLKLDLLESMGLGIVDRNVTTGHLYDYVLTLWTPAWERLCSRVDGVSPIEPPPVPPPTDPKAEAMPTTLPDQPGARRPHSDVSPIGVSWTSSPPAASPPPSPYAPSAYGVIAYLLERKVGAGGTWAPLGESPILEVKRTYPPTNPPSGPPGPLPLTPPGNASSPEAHYRYLDRDTTHGEQYFYRVSAMDWLGRTSAPTAEVDATAYTIPEPLAWKTFTATWNGDGTNRRVDVQLTLREAMPVGRTVYLERTARGPQSTTPPYDTEIGLTPLHPASPWSGAGLSFSLEDAAVSEKTTYVYRLVMDGPLPGMKTDLNVRTSVVVPDLTPPAFAQPLSYVLRPGTPLPQAVADALVAQHAADQKNQPKWDAAIATVTQEIADERAALLPKTVDSFETVVLPSAMAGKWISRLEVGLDPLDPFGDDPLGPVAGAAAPNFASEKMPLPLQAEVRLKNGSRIVGDLVALDLEGPGSSLSAHLTPAMAPIACDGRLIPWEETESVSFLWRTTQPSITDTPRRMAIPSIADKRGRVTFPQVASGTSRVAVGASNLHVKLIPTDGASSLLSQTLTGNANAFEWTFDASNQTPKALEVREIRLTGTPWRLSTPGKTPSAPSETLAYRWRVPDRRRPPEGQVLVVDIDDMPAPQDAPWPGKGVHRGRKATVHGSSTTLPSWTARGVLVGLTVGVQDSERPEHPLGGTQTPERLLGLDPNLLGVTVKIGPTDYLVEDLVQVTVQWALAPASRPAEGARPQTVTLKFHHRATLRLEDLPEWLDPDIKARALSLIETERFAPHVTEVEASREGVILYWGYPAPSAGDGFAGFNVYRAINVAAPALPVFERINPEPIRFDTVSATPFPTLPAGSPAVPAPPSGESRCWFQDLFLGGAGTKYLYRVTAVDDTGQESPFSPPTGLSVTVPDRAGPPAPVIVTVQPKRDGAAHSAFQGIEIGWMKPQHPYDIVVYRAEVGAPAGTLAAEVHRATSTDPTTWLDPGPFVPTKSYEYFLRGDSGTLGNAGTLGKPSETRTVAVRAEDVPPTVAPGSFTAIAAAGGAQLTWIAPAASPGVTIANYVVERRRVGSPVFRPRAGPLPATTLSFLDDRVVAGVSYEYRLIAIDGHGTAWPSLYPVLTFP